LLQRRQDDDDNLTIPDIETPKIKTYQSFDHSSSSSSSLTDSDDYLAVREGMPPRQLSGVTITESTQLLQNKQQEPGLLRRIVARVHGFMSPPLYAASLALIVGLSPLKPFLYDKHSFLYPSFTKAIELCGKAAVPIILTCLGAQLVSIQESQQATSPEMKKPVAIAILVRMFLMPFLVVPAVVLFALYGSSTLASDPVFITMMIVLGCSPTAINLVQITQVNQIFEEEMLRMLFWSYGVVCVPVCTLVVFAALNIVDKWL
jgi:predicted permease